jgi:hypothetical protein
MKKRVLLLQMKGLTSTSWTASHLTHTLTLPPPPPITLNPTLTLPLSRLHLQWHWSHPLLPHKPHPQLPHKPHPLQHPLLSHKPHPQLHPLQSHKPHPLLSPSQSDQLKLSSAWELQLPGSHWGPVRSTPWPSSERPRGCPIAGRLA